MFYFTCNHGLAERERRDQCLASLPDSVGESMSINSFKNNLDKFWQKEDVEI